MTKGKANPADDKSQVGRGRGRRRRGGPAAPLTRARIVRAALALVDREGLQALSMRKLGAELEVDPMAVYHHLPSKDALLDAIVEAIMTEIDLTRDRPADPPEERIMVCARAYRDALLAHGNALPIALARRPATPGALRPVELLIGVLRSAGLAPHQAVAGMNAIAAAVRGMVGMVANQGSAPVEPADRSMLDERLPADLFPFLREAICNGKRDLERDFEFGIRALARGLVLPPSGQPR